MRKMKSFKKFIKYFVLIVVLIPCFALMSACSVNLDNQKYITNIEKTKSVGLVDVYTITYSDNSTSSFSVSNGKNGEDAQKVTIEEIYEALKQRNYTKSFEEFLMEYLTLNSSSNTETESVSKAILSCVSVYTQFEVISDEPVYTFNPIFGYIQNGTQQTKSTSVGAGSGVIFSLDKENGDAYIITNYHVVYNESANNKIGKVKVFLYGSDIEVYYEQDDEGNYVNDENGYPKIHYSSSSIDCEYIGGSLTYDLAVLKVTGSKTLKNSNARQVDLSNGYIVGETAIAIGNPSAGGISVTKGVVSVESEYISMTAADEKTKVTFRTMRIDTAINSGNSGGGLFNTNGELIGIVNAKIVDDEIENIAYSIPRDIVVNVANNLIYNYEMNETKKVYKITFGLTLETQNSRAVYDSATKETTIVEDVIIKEISASSLASTINLAKGDKIEKIVVNDKTYSITRLFNAIDCAVSINVGDTVTYKIDRGGEKIDVTFVANSANFSYVE